MKYLGIMILVFILMSLGYIILPPQPISSKFDIGIVDTETNKPWQIIVNIIRMALFGYALYKYIMITKKTEGEAKKRIKLFSIGIIIVIFGLIFNLVGGVVHKYEIEIFALILFNIAAIIIVKGLLI
jgi:hypothetical protein